MSQSPLSPSRLARTKRIIKKHSEQRPMSPEEFTEQCKRLNEMVNSEAAIPPQKPVDE